MLNRFYQEDPHLTEAIASAFEDLKIYDANSAEYKAIVKQLTALQAMKKKRLDPNTVLTVAGNIAIGFAVINHERTAVITSKVWTFLMKK